MNTSIIFAACVVAWAFAGWVELWLDTRWYRRQFPRFEWSPPGIGQNWPVMVAGPLYLACGIYFRHVNGRR